MALCPASVAELTPVYIVGAPLPDVAPSSKHLKHWRGLFSSNCAPTNAHPICIMLAATIFLAADRGHLIYAAAVFGSFLAFCSVLGTAGVLPFSPPPFSAVLSSQ